MDSQQEAVSEESSIGTGGIFFFNKRKTIAKDGSDIDLSVASVHASVPTRRCRGSSR